jgi:chaperonin cofactor prefoldin
MSEKFDQLNDLQNELENVENRIEEIETELSELEWERNNLIDDIQRLKDDDGVATEIVEATYDEIKQEHARQRLIARYGTDQPETIHNFFDNVKAFSPQPTRQILKIKGML